MRHKHSRQRKLDRKAKKAAKSQQRQHQRERKLRPSAGLVSGLNEADSLIAEGELDDAAQVLEELARRFPRRQEALVLLLDVYLKQHDMWSYQGVCQKLTELDPDSVDAWLGLAGSALDNSQMATAHRAFTHLLTRWPGDREAIKSGQIRGDLVKLLSAEAAKFGMRDDDGYDLLLLHDEINFHLHQGNYDQVVQLADDLLGHCPVFSAALNNRSEAQFRRGRLDVAVIDARRVLEFDPINFHALANLTRYLFLSGDCDEARGIAERLKEAKSDSPDLFVKQAESLAILGDWQGILDALQRAEEGGIDGGVTDLGLLYHLAGVAAAELNRAADARRYWKRSIGMESVAEWSRENLADQKKPTGEGSGPWAFPIDHWIPRAVLERFATQALQENRKRKGTNVGSTVRHFLEQNPYLEKLAPVLLERGDPATKEFVVRMTSMSESPTLLAALHDFAFGQRGSDQMRYSAAMALLQANRIEPGPRRTWVRGEWHDIRLMTQEINYEPSIKLPKNVESLARQAWQAIHEGEGAKAESLLDQALRKRPNDPSLAFNRAIAIQLQRRDKEAMSLFREIHARHPDYLFARVKLAEAAIECRDFDAAKELLDPLIERQQFHHSEYAALCHANIELQVAKGETKGALGWLQMWESMTPDDERVLFWKTRLDERELLGRIWDRMADP